MYNTDVIYRLFISTVKWHVKHTDKVEGEETVAVVAPDSKSAGSTLDKQFRTPDHERERLLREIGTNEVRLSEGMTPQMAASLLGQFNVRVFFSYPD